MTKHLRFFCISVLLLPLIGVYPTAAQAVADWTVMIYMAADNDLEKFAVNDINELEFVGSTDRVNIVVQIDRAEGYDDSAGDWTDARRYLITTDFDDAAGVEINAELRAELGEVNTGDPATLSDFVVWSMTTFPSEKVALVLWNHGGAWQGIAADKSAENDLLTLVELDTALNQAAQQTNNRKIDLIGFDACLMGALEVYQAIAPYGSYAVGSAELVPGYGWNYTDLMFDLTDNPAMDAPALGSAIIDRFIEHYDRLSDEFPNVGIGMIDLSKVEVLITALDTFSQRMQESSTRTLRALIEARNLSLVYGSIGDPRYADYWSAVDLFQMMGFFAQIVPDETLQSAALNVVQAGQSLTAYYRGSGTLTTLGGTSIFFPSSLQVYEADERANRYSRSTPPVMTTWQRFLLAVYAAAAQIALQPGNLMGGGLRSGGLTLQPNTSGTVTSAEIIVTAPGPDGLPMVIAYRNALNAAAQVQPQFTTLRSGNTAVQVLPLATSSGQPLICGRYSTAGQPPVDAQMVINPNTGQISSLWGIQTSANGFVLSEISYTAGDTFTPVLFSLDENNALVARDSGAEFTLSAPDDTTAPAFALETQPAPDGEYAITVVIETLDGQDAIQEIAVAWDDSGEITLLDELLTLEEIDAAMQEFDLSTFAFDTTILETLDPETFNFSTFDLEIIDEIQEATAVPNEGDSPENNSGNASAEDKDVEDKTTEVPPQETPMDGGDPGGSDEEPGGDGGDPGGDGGDPGGDGGNPGGDGGNPGGDGG